MRLQRPAPRHAICADLDRTTAFYRDVLGLALAARGPQRRRPRRAPLLVRRPGATAGIARLVPGVPGARARAASGAGSTHHFAFAVASADELDAWREYLRARGVECTDVFERGGLRSIYLRDPDGHVLEIATPAG